MDYILSSDKPFSMKWLNNVLSRVSIIMNKGYQNILRTASLSIGRVLQKYFEHVITGFDI